jgi:hypothetical protein
LKNSSSEHGLLDAAGRMAGADYEAGIVKVSGHSFVRDGMTGLMIEKSDERTKILSIASGTLLVHQLPDTVEIGGLRFEIVGTQLLLTNGRDFAMNLTEHPHNGQL